MYTQTLTANGTEVVIQVPEELAGKELQVTVEEASPKSVDRDKLLAEAQAYFRSIAVDMSDYKFNREEANER